MQLDLPIASGHTDSVEAVALSSALPVAATASIDGKVLVWDNATLSVRGTCEHPEVMVTSACTVVGAQLRAPACHCTKHNEQCTAIRSRTLIKIMNM